MNGMLSLPERQDALEKVRMGEAAMLPISPEQLRSVSVRSVLRQREIGLWVLDEAHRVSGARRPSGLPLRFAVHQGDGGRCRSRSGDLPDRHREAGGRPRCPVIIATGGWGPCCCFLTVAPLGRT